MAEALGKTHFPTMLSGVLRGRRKGDPNTSVVGKIPSEATVKQSLCVYGDFDKMFIKS